MAVVLMLAVFAVMSVVLRSTPFGRYLLATGGNPTAAYVAGVPTRRMVLFAFCLSGCPRRRRRAPRRGPPGRGEQLHGQGPGAVHLCRRHPRRLQPERGKGPALGMLGGRSSSA